MSTRSGASETSSVPRRRNGRQQACEPCHRRKVACDHRLPSCSRCKRGGISAQCIYLTQRGTPKRASPATPAPTPPSPTLSRVSRETRSALEVPEPTSVVVQADELNVTSHGYLGATSLSAVIREAQANLFQNDAVRGLAKKEQLQRCSSFLEERPSEMMINILRSLPDKETAYKLFNSNISHIDGWCRLAAKMLHDRLWDTFGDVLEGTRTSEQLAELAVKICYSSSAILLDNQADPKLWLDEFSGENLRWESLGILFNFWTAGLLSLRQSSLTANHVLMQKENYSKRLQQYKTCVSDCAKLCWNSCSQNSLMAYLLHRHCITESQIVPDTDLRVWRLHGETITMVTYLGLHALPPPFNERSVSVQIKRRLFTVTFVMDKVIATFTGRPPVLSRRFCSTPLPLDISDEELLQLPPFDKGKQSTLDADGWNTTGDIYATTVLRGRAIFGYIRDAILELALRGPSQDCEATLLDLKQQSTEAMARLPGFLRFDAESMSERLLDHRGQTYGRLQIRLEHLMNLFFIERLMAKVAFTSATTELVRISLEIMKLALIPTANQSLLEGALGDMEWTILCFAAPAGGVLCMELLRPSEASSGPEPVTRSTLIQQLSLLVGALEWVRPTSTNNEMSKTVMNAIKQVLDRVLDPPSNIPGQTNAFDGWGLEFSSDMNDLFNFELLDTYDWLRPDVTNHAL